MSRSRYPVTFLKGALGLCLAVLLVAPVAVLWSGSFGRVDEPGSGRQPLPSVSGQSGEVMPSWWVEQEVAWLQKNKHRFYGRGADFWPEEMGKRHLGAVDPSESRSPYVIHLPGGKGSFHSSEGAPGLAPGLMKEKNGPVRARGEYYIAQLSPGYLRGKTSQEVRGMVQGLGAEVLEVIPNNAFLLRVKGAQGRQELLGSSSFQFVDAYHPAYKIDRRVGKQRLLSPERAASSTLSLVVRSHKGVDAGDLRAEIERAGGTVTHVQGFNGRQIVGVDIENRDLFKLARVDDIYLIQEKTGLNAHMLSTSLQTEVGRILDDRVNGGFVRPFTALGIDGGGEYATDPSNVPLGCNAANIPFDPAVGTVDASCFTVQPQFIGLIDNGLTLDASPFAHSQTSPCIGSCGTNAQNTGVGITHRKVEVYVRSRDLNNDGVFEDATAEGDNLTCDSISAGGDTHGTVVAGVMNGNATEGPFGLGIRWDANGVSNQFVAFFNDENERQLPGDGQARGARLLFIDAMGTGVAPTGSPACATNLLSDVDAGLAVIDDVEALAFRRDLSLANSTLHPRGAKIIALPFGAPTDFNTDVDDGHNTYAGDAQDLDEFLFSNRRVLVAVASGNDGANENTGADVDPPVPTDPNDVFDADDIQIQDLASGKNTVVVGMNQTDTLEVSLSATDQTEFIVNASSKGPCTLASLRICPFVMAPGNEPARGGGGFEGSFSGGWGDSLVALQSFDNEQDTGEGVENVRHHKKTGTSYSTGKVAGAAAQIREWFSEGFYPNGNPDVNARVSDVSGALVKAILAGSTDWATSGPLISSCTNRPCIEQGYGKVELANILPIFTYTDTRRPRDKSNQTNEPTLPRNLLVVDEYLDGGVTMDVINAAGTLASTTVAGIGVISPGETREVEFTVEHGGQDVRSVLTWYDAGGELLVNDLDLAVNDGDYQFTEGWDTAFGYTPGGSGSCSSSYFTAVGYGAYLPPQCGFCTIAGLTNPDTAYYDPTGNNPFVRRFLGNQLTVQGQYSQMAQCDSVTGLLDPGDPASVRDSTNPAEMVHIYTAHPFAFNFLGARRGTLSDGPYKAEVSWTNGIGTAVGAPDVPCVSGGPDGVVDTAVAGDDHVVTANGVEYIASGTTTVACGSYSATLADDDVQLVADGAIAQPFALIVSGALSWVGNSSPSSVSLDKERYDCSDTSLNVTVAENDTSAVSDRRTHARLGTVVEVMNSLGAVVDSEAGITFQYTVAVDPHHGEPARNPSVFRPWTRMSSTSNDVRVQFIGNLTNPLGGPRKPVANNGMVEVNTGDTIRARYTDPTDSSDTDQTEARVVCEPKVSPGFVLLAIENAKQKFIGGGCDFGRTIALRGDFNLDAGERLQYQVHFNNHSGADLKGVRATLSCSNDAAASPASNPCQFINIIDPVNVLGRIPFSRESAATWNIEVDEAVTTLATADRVVFLDVEFSTTSTDDGGTVASQGFRFREALHADNDIRFYSSDMPTGGLQFKDYNRNGLIDLAEFNNGGVREGLEIRNYGTWFGTPNQHLADPNGTCPGGCVPFDFDLNNGGFTSFLTADSIPGPGYPAGSQGWFHSTGGACGWQTQAPGSGAVGGKGAWHAGGGPVGAVGTNCPEYISPSDSTDGSTNNFVSFMLHSPVFEKANPGVDARGFAFDVRAEGLSWNANEELANNAASVTINIDMKLAEGADDGEPTVLGTSYAYRPITTITGPRTGAQNSAARFGPIFNPDAVFPSGDEVGIATPLASYDPANFVQRPLMPFPAADADPNAAGFQSDERVQTAGNLCGNLSIPVGKPCRAVGFTTPEGPIRNRIVETGGSYEDFRGASGNKHQFEFQWFLSEGGASSTHDGYTIDDIVWEWSEQHPGDQLGFVGGDCSLDNVGGGFGITCNPSGPFPNGTCSGGVRNGLFCNLNAGNDDCRDVVAEGVCSSLSGVCTAGMKGKACSGATQPQANNQCDVGRCLAGNTELGCGTTDPNQPVSSANAVCNQATNDCDSIPFRVSAINPLDGTAGVAGQCAIINFNREFTFDCIGSLEVTVQDETPDVVGTVAGTCSSLVCSAGHVGDACAVNADCDVRQIEVNARTPAAGEPLGEDFILDETAKGSSIFRGTVPYSSLVNTEGAVFVNANPGDNFNIFVSYFDAECDQDRDAKTGEAGFADVDGDGTLNFGADGVLGDQDPVRNFQTGGPVSDDDNCFVASNATDVYNPSGVAQLDLNADGFVTGADCVVNPNHNDTGQCDFDSDGIGDICDNCPKNANNNQQDADNDGIGNSCEVTDIDGDGVDNTVDTCPTIGNQSDQSVDPGTRCNSTSLAEDFDGDGFTNNVDNCPNSDDLLEENAPGDPPGVNPHECNSTAGHAECYNPDQRDQDQDGIGDVCDEEDDDNDNVFNVLDNCPTVYNPADPAFSVQADSDGDGFGDDGSGTDSVGACVGGPTPGKTCTQIGTGVGCGAGGFCVQFAHRYCDPDSTDDNNDATPDDIVQFTTEIVCNWNPGGIQGHPQAEIASIALSSAIISDDGTADFMCVSGDPNPNNNPLVPEACPEAGPAPQPPEDDPALRAAAIGVTGTTLDMRCDPVTPANGDCEPVPDGTVDPGERANLQLKIANATLDITGAGRPLTNVEVGIASDSPTIGCITKGSTFVGTFPAGATITTAPGGLSFIVDPATTTSTPAKFAEASFTVTIRGDDIQGYAIAQTFKATLDTDKGSAPFIPSNCGNGTGLSSAHSAAGVLCEDFDTDRNGNGVSGNFSRLAIGISGGVAVGDPGDDVLGFTMGGGPVPAGVQGLICSSDPGPITAQTCHPVPSENDWHLHSAFEGCDDSGNAASDDSYDLGDPTFDTSCAPWEKAHSGFRSLHMGRHLNATDTTFDTYRWRQVSAFVLDPFNLGTNSLLEFWHIISVADDREGITAGTTLAGGQVQMSLFNAGTGLYEPWERLAASQNGYGAVDQEQFTICEFDPGDDKEPRVNETMCGGKPQWSEMGDLCGNDLGCVVDNECSGLGVQTTGDCGDVTNKTVVGSCQWVASPTCGSFLENGGTGTGLGRGTGVWIRSQFDLQPFSGRQARLRWIFEGGGGWQFGQSRSWLEPEPGGSPYFGAFNRDDGWYVDDIKLTDLRTAPASIDPDPIDGLAFCPTQGDPGNCDSINIVIAGSAVDARTGGRVLFAQDRNTGTQVSLDARQSTAVNDPNVPGDGTCPLGVLEFRWTNLGTGEVLQEFGPGGEVKAVPTLDSTYRVEARCSSDRACTASSDVQVLTYPGEGRDLAPSFVADSQGGFTPDGIDGLAFALNATTQRECDPNNNASISWRSRPQPPGVSGYDLFECSTSLSGSCSGGGPGSPVFSGACAVPNIAPVAVGGLVSTTIACPALGSAKIWAAGHSSANGLALTPLGFDPVGGEVVVSAVTCP